MNSNTTIKALLPAYKFFKQNAGYIVGQQALGALALAKAEKWAQENDIEFSWQYDDDADYSFVDTWSEKDRKEWTNPNTAPKPAFSTAPARSAARSAFWNPCTGLSTPTPTTAV